MEAGDYENIKSSTKALFDATEPVYCPAIEAPVHFNMKGFKHIIFRHGGHERDFLEQIKRFKMMPFAVKLIGKTTTFQEFEKVTLAKEVTFYGFIAIIEGHKIKTIIRKVGNGWFHFWSVIPQWRTNKRDEALPSFLPEKQ